MKKKRHEQIPMKQKIGNNISDTFGCNKIENNIKKKRRIEINLTYFGAWWLLLKHPN